MARTQITTNSLKDSSITPEKLAYPFSFTGQNISSETLSSLSVTTNSLTARALSSTQVPLTVQGTSGQTANLQEWKNSSGTVIGSINNSGNIIINAISGTGLTVVGNISATGQVNGTGFRAPVNASGFTFNGAVMYLDSSTLLRTNDERLSISRDTTTKANLRLANDSNIGWVNGQVYVSSPDTYLSRYAPGALQIGTGTLSANGSLVAGSLSAISPILSSVPLVVQGASGQTANLQEWKNSSGTELVRISPSGSISINNTGGTPNIGDIGGFVRWINGSVVCAYQNGSAGTTFRGNIGLQSGTPTGGSFDVALYPDNTNVLALRNGLNRQTFNIYNTYTNSSNYERAYFKWDTDNVFKIGTEVLGTGTAKELRVGNSSSYLSIETDNDLKLSRGSDYFWLLNNSGRWGSGGPISLMPTTNVGIGTLTPNEKLTVVGNISATGKITSSGQGALSALQPDDVLTKSLGDQSYLPFQMVQLSANSTSIDNSGALSATELQMPLNAGTYDIDIFYNVVGFVGAGFRVAVALPDFSYFTASVMSIRATGSSFALTNTAFVNGAVNNFGNQTINAAGYAYQHTGTITLTANNVLNVHIGQQTPTVGQPVYLGQGSYIKARKISNITI